ncbi:MAG: ATP-binding protein, partial [Halobacteriota archaeon]
VFVPVVEGTRYSARGHRAEQLPITIPFELVRSNPWLVAGSRLNDRQVNALDTLLSSYFDRTADPTYRGFVAYVEDEATVHDFTDDGRIHERTYEAVLRRISHPTFRRTFDQDAQPITEVIPRFVREGGISTIPTYHLDSGHQRTLVVLAIASLIIDEKLTSDPTYDRIAEVPLVLAMDEAHNYLAEASSEQAYRTIGKFTDAAKQGRKERLGLFLVTQDPGDIAEAIRKQLNTKIALNLADEDAIASLNLEGSLAKQVPELETGQLVVHSPDNAAAVQLVGLDECVVAHGSH